MMIYLSRLFGFSRNITRTLIVTLLLIILHGCGGELTDQEYLQRAKEFQDKGNLNASVIELKNALRNNPNNTEARWVLGEIYLEVGEGAAAEKELRRALELGIDRQVIHNNLGRALLLQGAYDKLLNEITPVDAMSAADRATTYALRADAFLLSRKPDQAKESIEKAFALKPDSSDALIAKARYTAAFAKYSEASEWVNKALKIAPESAAAWALLGDLERAQGKTREAEAAYTNALKHNQFYIVARTNRALMRIYLGNAKGAESDIKLLKRRATNHPRVAFVNGVFLLSKKKPADAQVEFEKSLKYMQDYSPTLYYLGIAHLIQNNLQQASHYLAQVVQKYPSFNEARKMLGSVYMQMSDYASAEKVLQPVLNTDKPDADAMAMLGNALILQGRLEDGTGYLRQALTLKPDLPRVRMQLGIGLIGMGKKETGLQYLKEAVDLDPKGQQEEIILFTHLLGQKEYDKAIDTAKDLQKKRQDDALILNFLGLAHLGKGEEAQARAAFEKAWKQSPGDPLTAENLAKLALKENQPDKAQEYIQAVQEHHPEHVDAYLKLSDLAAMKGDGAKSLTLLEDAVKMQPGALRPRVKLARSYLALNRPLKAITVLNDIKGANVQQPQYLDVLGDTQLALQESYRAVSTFEKLRDIQPNSAEVHFKLAKAYIQQNEFDKAQTMLIQALQFAPGYLPAMSTQVRVYLAQNKAVEAKKGFDQITLKYPNHPEVNILKGLFFMHEKKYKDAAHAFNDALKQTKSRELTLYLAEAQWKGGERQKTLETLGKWLKTNPEDVAIRFSRANFLRITGDHKGAKAEYSEVLKMAPKNISVLNNMSMILRKEDPKQALEYAQRAYDLAPRVPMIMDTLGLLLFDSGEKVRAQRLLKEATDKAPNNGTINFHYAELLADDGKKEQARGILRKILSNTDNFEQKNEARDLLKKLGG